MPLGSYGKTINMQILRAKTKELLQTRELNPFQSDNSSLNISEMEEGKTVLKSYPRRILLELTSACNLKCIMCGRDEVEFKKSYLDVNILSYIKNVLESAEEVALFGWGEPTVHPDFSEFLKRLSNYNVRKYFVTNGMLLDKFINDVINYKTDIIAISLDGATPDTNNSIRKHSDFNKIISNIKLLQGEKKELKLSYPYMNFVFTAMKSNIQELPDLVNLAYDLGLEEVKVVYLTIFSNNLINESLYDNKELVEKYFKKAEEIAEKLDVKLKLPYLQGEDVAGDKYHKDCFNAWRDIFISSDLTVRPCQSTSLKFFDLDKNKPFMEIWNSEIFQNFRRTVNSSDMPLHCKNCYQSSFANWNKKTSFIQVGNQFAPEWKITNTKKNLKTSCELI